MYQSPVLDVWTLTPGITAKTGAQSIFNVVGCLKDPARAARLYYRLNDGPERPVFFNPNPTRLDRLEQHGEFNIDTIFSEELGPENRIAFRVEYRDGTGAADELTFRCDPFESAPTPGFHLDLDGIQHAEQVAQIVDGQWLVDRDAAGEPYLAVAPDRVDYDKIVLFGRSEWTTGYTITARIGIVAWSKPRHIAGLLFKWNPHDQGDGTHLPATWSTGLGVYHSDHGLRLQYGVNVTVNEQGQEVGVTTLAERHYSRWRYWAWVAKYNKTWPGASFRRTRIFPHQHPLAQLPAGRQYRWRLVVRPDEHRLTVWPADRPEPRPQLVAPAPPGLLDGGSVGLLSYRAALRLYEFDVTVG